MADNVICYMNLLHIFSSSTVFQGGFDTTQEQYSPYAFSCHEIALHARFFVLTVILSFNSFRQTSNIWQSKRGHTQKKKTADVKTISTVYLAVKNGKTDFLSLENENVVKMWFLC